MRAYELLYEYDRQITLRDVNVQKKIYEIFKQYDRMTLNHWLSQDVKYINLLNKLEKQYGGDVSKMPEADYIRYSKIKSMMSTIDYDVSQSELSPKMVSNRVVQEFEQYDPTKNKKYMPWIVSQYVKGNILRLEDMTNIEYMLRLYDDNKKRRGFPPEAKDITKLSVDDLKRVTKRFNPDDPEGISQNIGSYDIVYGKLDVQYDEYNNLKVNIVSDVVVVRIKDLPASLYFGRVLGGLSDWCTAYIPPRTNMFSYYNNQGKLYTIIPKDPIRKNEKYLIHYESDQIMNENDRPVTIEWLLNTRFPEIKDIILNTIPEYKSHLAFIPDDLILDVWNGIMTQFNQIIDDSIEYVKYTLEDSNIQNPEYKLLLKHKVRDMTRIKNDLTKVSLYTIRSNSLDNTTIYKLPETLRNILRGYKYSYGIDSSGLVSSTYNIYIKNASWFKGENADIPPDSIKVDKYIIYHKPTGIENPDGY